MGLFGGLLNKIANKPITIYLKFIWCIVGVVGIPLASDYSKFGEAKFIGIVTFGYTLYRMWGENKPVALLYKIWFFLYPCLFGTVGA